MKGYEMESTVQTYVEGGALKENLKYSTGRYPLVVDETVREYQEGFSFIYEGYNLHDLKNVSKMDAMFRDDILIELVEAVDAHRLRGEKARADHRDFYERKMDDLLGSV